MLLHIFVVISILVNLFLLNTIGCHIKIGITIGLLYSVLLFLYFLIHTRVLNIIILFSGFAYWLLISCISNANYLAIHQSVNNFSFIFNAIAALIILIFVLILSLELSISAFPILLMSHSLLAVIMHFSGMNFNYFMWIYIASMLLLGLITFLHNFKKSKSEFKATIIINGITYAIFFMNELALEKNYYSFTFLQNYNLKELFDAVHKILSSLWCSLISLEYENHEALNKATTHEEALNSSHVNAMWKGRGNPSRPRPLSSLYPTSTPTSAIVESSTNKIATTDTPSISSFWSRISSLSFFSNSSSLDETTSSFEDREVITTINEERAIAIHSSSRQLASATDFPYSRPLNNRAYPIRYNACFSNSTNTTSILAHLYPLRAVSELRTYSTSSQLALGYSLKAEFDVLEDADILISKVQKLNAEDINYAYIDQSKIPVLKGLVGTHPMVVFTISDNVNNFLGVLTTSPHIPSADSTYSEKNKVVYEKVDKHGNKRVLNQELIGKLLWKKENLVVQVVVEPEQIQQQTQKLAPTFFILSNDLADEVEHLGIKKDPLGTEKVLSIKEELKRAFQIVMDRSRLDEDPSKIKVVVLSKK